MVGEGMLQDGAGKVFYTDSLASLGYASFEEITSVASGALAIMTPGSLAGGSEDEVP